MCIVQSIGASDSLRDRLDVVKVAFVASECVRKSNSERREGEGTEITLWFIYSTDIFHCH